MSTELKNAVKAADAIPQYGMCVKRLLAEKNIIANILVNAVDVYKGMVPEDVVPYIEGEPSLYQYGAGGAGADQYSPGRKRAEGYRTQYGKSGNSRRTHKV